MKSKILSVLLCASMVATMLVGCGSKEEAPAAPAEPPAPPADIQLLTEIRDLLQAKK